MDTKFEKFIVVGKSLLQKRINTLCGMLVVKYFLIAIQYDVSFSLFQTSPNDLLARLAGQSSSQLIFYICTYLTPKQLDSQLPNKFHCTTTITIKSYLILSYLQVVIQPIFYATLMSIVSQPVKFACQFSLLTSLGKLAQLVRFTHFQIDSYFSINR